MVVYEKKKLYISMNYICFHTVTTANQKKNRPRTALLLTRPDGFIQLLQLKSGPSFSNKWGKVHAFRFENATITCHSPEIWHTLTSVGSQGY